MITQPSADDQVRFLLNIQRLLNEGVFTATYKYAMLLALAAIDVEIGDDSGAPLRVPVRRIAEKCIAYYWRQTVPYIPKGTDSQGAVLKQSTDRQAAIIQRILDARREHGDSLAALQRDKRAWRSLVSKVSSVFWEQPLWRLERIGNDVLDFLYDNRTIGTRVDAIELYPGVAFCLRRFHVLISELVRGAWLQYIRKVNAVVLGSTQGISEFLFGSERADLSALRPMLTDLQSGRCFYCDRDMSHSADIEHFIPWSRYPVDLGHNFVLAHQACNCSKGSMLVAEEHLAHWAERNRRHGDVIATECDRVNFVHDLGASIQIARWAYEQTFVPRGLTWSKSGLVAVSEGWIAALVNI